MAIKYLVVCKECGTSFESAVNVPKDEAVCPACEMMDGTYPGNEHLHDPDSFTQTVGPHDNNVIVSKGQKEKLGSGMTGKRSRHDQQPNRLGQRKALYRFKDKICPTCKKSFSPSGPRQVYCELHRPETKAERHAKSKWLKASPELTAAADALLKASEPPPPPKEELLAVPANNTSLPCNGIIEVHKQPDSTVLTGYWIAETSGKTFDNQDYAVRRNPVTGQICLQIDKCVYLTDATSHK